MNVPYNTGKVKIGQFYERPQPIYDVDKDMSMLQTALIGDIKAIKREKLAWYIYMAVLVFGLSGAILLGKN